jgi:hypothetical protein
MTSLITLPIRLPLEITYRAAKLGVEIIRTVAGILEHDPADQRAPRPAAEDVETVIVAEPSGSEYIPPTHVEAPVDFDAPSEEELAPPHVDAEAELTYEAGPGEDVGAQVHVDPPWDGYDHMRAADIVDRLRVSDEATRAVVRLYEAQGKARSSVLAATS